MVSLYRSSISCFILLIAGAYLKGQTTIATGLPGCLPVVTQVGVSCGGGTFQFGVIANQFVVNNIDGAACCTPTGGDGESYFEFAELDISNFSNVNISLAFSASNTGYEDDSPGAPIFGCQGSTPPDNSHDQIIFEYSINGGAFVQSLYVHGTTQANFTGTWTAGPLNGNTLTIRIYASNKAQAEIFYFQTLNITGTPLLSAGPNLTICGTNPVTLQGTGTGTWSGGAGTYGDTGNPTTTYTPASSESGSSVTLTYSGTPAYTGCPAPSDQMVLTINSAPTPTITGNTASCSTVTLTASGGNTGATYTWSGGNNAGNATNTFTSSGTYVVTVTNTTGCTATAETMVTINTPPVANISGPTTGCGNITLTASGAGSNGTYLWSGGNNPSNSINTFTTSGTYTVTITDANGCTATASQTITVSTPPNVTISGPTTGCGSVILSATGGASGSSYVWSGGNNPNDPNNVITLSGTYTVTVTDPSGCTGTASATVTINTGPAGTLSGSAVLCPGQCATFSFTFTSGSQPYTVQLTASPPGFNFSIPGVTTSQTFQVCYQGFVPSYNASTNTVNIPTFLTGTGSLTLTGISDGSGCPGTASGSFNLTLTSAPTATSTNLTLCETANGQATFNLTSLNSAVIGGGNGTTVNWFQDMAGTIPISNPSAYTTGTTTVYAQVSNGGCTSPLVPVNLTVEPSSVPFLNMFCAESGTPTCQICLMGSTADLQFVFGDSRNYNVTVKNLTTNAVTTGLVNNGTNLSVPVSGTTTFQLESIKPAPGCPNTATYTQQVTITIIPPPDINPLSPPPTCDEFILPAITGTNLSGNQGYFTGQNGTGTQYFPGQAVTMSITLYMYDENAGCDDEEPVNIVILPPVTFDQLQDMEGCESVGLPAITGPNVSSSAYYNTAQDGTGTTYQPGAIVTQSLTLYAIDPQADPACVTNVLELEIIVHPLPSPANVSVDCSGGNGNGVAIVNQPVGNEYEYSLDGLPFQTGTQFTGLSNGTHIIKVKNTDTDCEQTSTFQVSCDCSTPAVINLNPSTGSTCDGQQFTSNQISFSGNTNEVKLSTNGAGTVSPTVVNSTPFTFTYVPSAADVGKTILITLETNDPDGPGPCAPEVRTFSLNVRANPVALIAGPARVCKGSNVTLIAAGGISYDWSNNGGSQPVATFSDIQQTTTYFVTVTDAFGCKDDASKLVEALFATAGRDTLAAFCNTNPITINLQTYLSSGSLKTGIWKSGPDTIKIPANFLVTNLPLGVNVLRYIINDSICGKDTALFRIEIRNKNNAGSDALLTLCSGELTEIDFDSAIAGHDPNGVWIQPPGASLSFSNPSSVDVSSLQPGIRPFSYIVAGNGCDSDTSIVTLDIRPFLSAGADVQAKVCAGSTINLLDLIKDPVPGGQILNPNNYSGLTSANWNSAGLPEATYSFLYQVTNVSPCITDTAFIRIQVQSALKAGADKTVTVCEGSTVDLKDYLASDADQGGRFLVNSQLIPNGIFTPPSGQSTFAIQYEVGDGLLCPKEQALITLNIIQKPSLVLAALPQLCAGQCTPLTISNTTSSQATYYLSALTQPTGPTYTLKLTSNAQGQVITQLCGAENGPYSFGQLPIQTTFIVRVDSLQSGACVFSENKSLQVVVRPLETKSYTKTICKSETIKIGNDIYSILKPTGQTRVPSQNAAGCDTLVNVNINFYPDARGTYTETFCDVTKTVTIGGQVFSQARPGGEVTLKGASVIGCDSIITVLLKYEKKSIPGTFALTTCNQEYELKLGSTIFSLDNPTGTALLEGAAAEGCDSLVQVTLIFEQLTTETDLSYTCTQVGASWKLTGASQPGPYKVSIDAAPAFPVVSLPYATVLTPGVHAITIENTAGCRQDLRFLVDDNGVPSVILTQTAQADGSFQLTASAEPAGSIYDLFWSPSASLSCTACLSPVASPAETTTYTLSYLYGTDCAGTGQITVRRTNTAVVIPNIFSPDGDGRNDVFFIPLPEGVTGTVKEMSIYDRWGNNVFVAKNVPANDPAEGWKGGFSGNQAVPGVYVYRVVLQLSGKANTEVFAGSVTLMK